MNRNQFLKLTLGAVSCGVLMQPRAFGAPNRFPLTDFHIHLRGGMTIEKAIERQRRTGIRSGVLENAGREWPLSTSEILQDFITHCREVAQSAGVRIPVGIQTNDRDWFTALDRKALDQLDFVLADTMIMDDPQTGKPIRLWKPELYEIADEEAWMERYMRHNLQILGEPVTILANPTYLPTQLAGRYEHFWTRERQETLIAKAVERGVALEIQATSQFPSDDFVKLAKRMGAKFSVGTNNFSDAELPIDRWYRVVDACGLTERDFLVL